jgi:ABC-type Na+ efflux pump permease subunit
MEGGQEGNKKGRLRDLSEGLFSDFLFQLSGTLFGLIPAFFCTGFGYVPAFLGTLFGFMPGFLGIFADLAAKASLLPSAACFCFSFSSSPLFCSSCSFCFAVLACAFAVATVSSVACVVAAKQEKPAERQIMR